MKSQQIICQLFLKTLSLSTLREPTFLSNGNVCNKAAPVFNPERKKIIMDLGDFNTRVKGNGV